MESIIIRPDAGTREKLLEIGAALPRKAVTLAELLRQPQLEITDLTPLWPDINVYEHDVLDQVQIEVKFEGYLKRQEEIVRRWESMENRALPHDLDYRNVPGLSSEVVEKLADIRPRTLGQAGRISGVTPAAVSSLQVYLKSAGFKK